MAKWTPSRLIAETERILTGGIGWPSFIESHEKIIRRLASHNWFTQPETPVSVIEDIEDCGEDIDRLNAILTESTESLLDEIRSRLVLEYPERKAIVLEIFALHYEERFLASIPLALATAEGIARKETNRSIFNVWRKRPEIAAWIDDSAAPKYGRPFLAALIESHPMAQPRRGYLNRHEVLHGRQIDYGNEKFSLQAISLLGFVGWAFSSEDGLISGQGS
ncbi:hypothetical protein ACQVRY_13870 [Ralstonia pseudosolanacearum]|nr:hypothetical protein [Ralstonia solanacearum]